MASSARLRCFVIYVLLKLSPNLIVPKSISSPLVTSYCNLKHLSYVVPLCPPRQRHDSDTLRPSHRSVCSQILKCAKVPECSWEKCKIRFLISLKLLLVWFVGSLKPINSSVGGKEVEDDRWNGGNPIWLIRFLDFSFCSSILDEIAKGLTLLCSPSYSGQISTSAIQFFSSGGVGRWRIYLCGLLYPYQTLVIVRYTYILLWGTAPISKFPIRWCQTRC